MRKRVVAKGNMRRSDFKRAVLTDTLPEEVPLIFSNDGFYVNAKSATVGNTHFDEFAQAIIQPQKFYTKPYRYNVLKDTNSVRGLSLIHPAAQIAVCEFYSQYDALVVYYAAKSPASLRHPVKVGSSFFVRENISAKNMYRGSSIDTVDIESAVSNPASYFAYEAFGRAHEFFDSLDYLHLEKRFKYFRTADVSKCFNSIYTHTLYWAVDSINSAKDNNSSRGLPNQFDKLMQSMNFNETNGICIGPEISRIFAEIILAEVDMRVINALSTQALKFRTDYDFRRYVDDFYIFSHDVATCDKITAAIQTALSDFNLYINERKTETIIRPFITKKSRLISEASAKLNILFDKIIAQKTLEEHKFSAPKRIFRPSALLKSFVSDIKAICIDYDTGYETITDYMISAFARRILELSDSYDAINKHGLIEEDSWITVIPFILELIYFFYTVNPTVRSSLNVARSVIVACRLFGRCFPERERYLTEHVVRWTIELEKSISRSNRHSDLSAVPVEVLNVMIPMFEVAQDEPLMSGLFDKFCSDVTQFSYFEIVTFIFLLGGKNDAGPLIDKLFKKAKDIIEEGRGLRQDAQGAHLCLDLLACPHIPLQDRASWFGLLRRQCSLSQLTRAECLSAVESAQRQFWFVRWDKVDLLRLLQKKELSAVY